jgi:uncharacterized peroxidase-related enzyme
LLKDEALAQAIESDFESADGLDERRTAMLRYTRKLTRTPADMTQADVESLRSVSFTDIDILHIVEVISYYAYVNRLADGLGVSLEDSHHA